MTAIEHQILYALFCLSRDTRHISATTLAAAVSLTPTRAASALLALERRGLCDATRARLTMAGLATAARLGPAAGGPKLDLSRGGQRAPRPVQPLPLAARPDRPDGDEERSIGGDGAAVSPLA
jgi:hypothetical protein